MVAFAAHQSPPPLLLSVMAIFFLLALLSCIHDGGGIGTSQAAVTDPSEVNAVNSIFTKWKISAKMSSREWNTSNDICSGVALEGGSVVNIYNGDSFNPGIICDCRFEGGSVCHITRLKASNLNITGRLPMELKKLTYLNNLLISKNYFTGPLPTFIGNFSEMLYISIGFNSFSGEIPKELGNLNKLKSLDLGLNNFTGRLPPELGNITGLEQMYMDSSGVTGCIPLSFAKFTKLKFMFAGDNKFGQKLPDFIGNLSSLQKLRFRGNSFQGPVPSRFSNLSDLDELWLTDLLDESSSLLFIENMTRLSTLILRNSKISGVVPSSIEKNTNLAYLDLSFNNLSGQIPQSLFNLPSLKSLYLGNNSFTGALPIQKSDQLQTVDLSCNDLSGSLPSWFAEDNLQLNLVANNFNSRSDLPRGLDCIQKNTPCFRDSPIYSSFAINCGGNEILLPDGTVYEADNENLSAASYFVNKDLRWAVSSIGSYLGASNSQYTHFSSSNFRKTSNQELVQSARTSPSSLRYYGLALENGNYNVTLKFAETAFLDAHSWLSLGKRIFDIYIQGLLVEKDFDIRRKAGERSFTAVSRSYTANVSSNFLEIHLFWAGKGSWSIPTDACQGPLISAISVTSNFNPTVSNRLPKKKNKALLSGLVAGIGAAVLLLPILGILIWRWKTRPISEDVEEDLQGLPVEPNCFGYAELNIATNGFNLDNKLGEGGSGSVFKGTLSDGRPVAIKQLTSLQGKKQFATEVATISAVQHRNLVKLYGCCYEGANRLLVYEYLENNNLNDALSGKSGLHLDWPARFDICLGTARGLAYLHEESSIRIVHRDIKASNILLDAKLNPKISDFGLAKLYDDRMTHISTRVAGTFGYLAPEYVMRGLLTEKADIYGFGIVVLEILLGRQRVGCNSDGRKVDLLEWAWQLHEKNRDLEMLDPSLSTFNEMEAIRMIQIAFLCTQTNPTLRPAMSRVIAMLVGNAEIGTVSSNKPYYLTEWDSENTSISSGDKPFLSTSTKTERPVSL